MQREHVLHDKLRRVSVLAIDVVLDVEKKKFEHIFDGVKHRAGVKFDYELQPDALKEIIAEYKKLVLAETGKDVLPGEESGSPGKGGAGGAGAPGQPGEQGEAGWGGKGGEGGAGGAGGPPGDKPESGGHP